MKKPKRILITAYGRVQGVGFRYSASIKARELQITLLFARNNENGSVSLLAEGEDQGIDKLIEWAAIGPPSARVDRIEVSPQ